MITSILELEQGISNLWKNGLSAAMKNRPTYNQYKPVNYFKVFVHGFPYLWDAEEYVGICPSRISRLMLSYHLSMKT